MMEGVGSWERWSTEENEGERQSQHRTVSIENDKKDTQNVSWSLVDCHLFLNISAVSSS